MACLRRLFLVIMMCKRYYSELNCHKTLINDVLLFFSQEEKLEKQNRISIEDKYLQVYVTCNEEQISRVRPFYFEHYVIIMHNLLFVLHARYSLVLNIYLEVEEIKIKSVFYFLFIIFIFNLIEFI